MSLPPTVQCFCNPHQFSRRDAASGVTRNDDTFGLSTDGGVNFQGRQLGPSATDPLYRRRWMQPVSV